MPDRGWPERDESDAARRLLQDIQRVASTASTEEDLRIGVEGALGPILEELGIENQPKYERSYLKGRSDAVYGHVVIEYERVGALDSERGVEHAASQLDRYLRGETSNDPAALKRVVGVGLDGKSIFFLRYRAGTDEAPLTLFSPEQQALFTSDMKEGGGVTPVRLGPFDVSEQTLQDFLLYLRSLRRMPLTAGGLAQEFGPDGEIGPNAVQAFYDALTTSDSPRVETFFKEWQRIFGIVYGESLETAAQDLTAIGAVYGFDEEQLNLQKLLFAIHTYYALLMKLLAAEIASLQTGALVSSVVANLQHVDDRTLQSRLADLEDGGFFARLGIRNYLEGDFFGWYLATWSSRVRGVVREIARRLGNFEPATGSMEPATSRDLLKKLYEYLVPRELRHALGEYYTPDWLAEFIIQESGFDGEPRRRVLDPACGSGTFLTLAIREIRSYADRYLLDPRDVVRSILTNVVGFDLNPLAVIAARTNYLLALGTLVRHVAPIEIPVYLCDSVLRPTSLQQREQSSMYPPHYLYRSTARDFRIPSAIVDHDELSEFTQLLEQAVSSSYSKNEFVSLVESRLESAQDADGKLRMAIADLFSEVKSLAEQGRNGIWARIIKNAFAPVSVGDFDFVLGNPPWIRWGYLADQYRGATLELWKDYGLFSLKGMEARLGAGEKDFSMLFVYACADHYLRAEGVLGFVITQEVLKSKGAGEGFRRFQLGKDGAHLGVFRADDFVEVRPFEGAANKTAAIFLRKGRETEYPVRYVEWTRKKGVGSIPVDVPLEVATEQLRYRKLLAKPTGGRRVNPWLTATEKTHEVLEALRGSPAYSARVGARAEPYGVYFLDLKAVRPDGLVVVENKPELGRTKIDKVEAALEDELIYPAIRGQDLNRWDPQPRWYVLIVQDPDERVGYPVDKMKHRWPHTYAYLHQFEGTLRDRAAFKKYFDPSDPFYSQFNIGSETFSSHRVAWRRMADDIMACVLGSSETPFGRRPNVAMDTTTLIAAATEDEAHFLAAVMNSVPVRAYVKASSSGGRGFGTPSVLKSIAIPDFDVRDETHRLLSEMSREAHGAIQEGSPTSKIEKAIDVTAASLWSVSESTVQSLRRTT